MDGGGDAKRPSRELIDFSCYKRSPRLALYRQATGSPPSPRSLAPHRLTTCSNLCISSVAEPPLILEEKQPENKVEPVFDIPPSLEQHKTVVCPSGRRASRTRHLEPIHQAQNHVRPTSGSHCADVRQMLVTAVAGAARAGDAQGTHRHQCNDAGGVKRWEQKRHQRANVTNTLRITSRSLVLVLVCTYIYSCETVERPGYTGIQRPSSDNDNTCRCPPITEQLTSFFNSVV
ncbi:hypothetical protein CBL_01940 [Carabus blaptoides fortunei]